MTLCYILVSIERLFSAAPIAGFFSQQWGHAEKAGITGHGCAQST